MPFCLTVKACLSWPERISKYVALDVPAKSGVHKKAFFFLAPKILWCVVGVCSLVALIFVALYYLATYLGHLLYDYITPSKIKLVANTETSSSFHNTTTATNATSWEPHSHPPTHSIKHTDPISRQQTFSFPPSSYRLSKHENIEDAFPEQFKVFSSTNTTTHPANTETKWLVSVEEELNELLSPTETPLTAEALQDLKRAISTSHGRDIEDAFPEQFKVFSSTNTTTHPANTETKWLVSVEEELNELLSPTETPLTAEALQDLKRAISTSQGRDYIKNNPKKLLCLAPCHNNHTAKKTRAAPTLCRETIQKIQTDPGTASRYLEGILLVFSTLGLSLTTKGELEETDSVFLYDTQPEDDWEDLSYEILLSTTVISLAECGFGLLARQFLPKARQGIEAGCGLLSHLKPAVSALTTGNLAKALPPGAQTQKNNFKDEEVWRQTYIVTHWGNYLDSDYFGNTYPPSQTNDSPKWFSLAQPPGSPPEQLREPLKPHRFSPPIPPKKMDPIFTGGKSNTPLLVWSPLNDKWELPHLYSNY